MIVDYTAIIVAVIVAIPPTLMAFLSWRVSLQNDKKITKAITEVHISLNSRLTQLLKASTGEAEAKGLAEGRKLGRAEK